MARSDSSLEVEEPVEHVTEAYQKPSEDIPTEQAKQERPRYIPDFASLLEYVSEDQLKKWARTFTQKVVMGESDENIRLWFESLKRLYGPQLKERQRCPHRRELFFTQMPSTYLPKSGQLDGCDMNCPHPK